MSGARNPQDDACTVSAVPDDVTNPFAERKSLIEDLSRVFDDRRRPTEAVDGVDTQDPPRRGERRTRGSARRRRPTELDRVIATDTVADDGPTSVWGVPRADVSAVTVRPRRLRTSAAMRRLVAETRLGVEDVVAPLFVREGIDAPVEISSLPGVSQHTLDSLTAETERLVESGVGAVILFGVPVDKDDIGSGAWDPEGIVQKALGRLKSEFGSDLVVMADLCLDEYTSHGHCGVVDARGRVDNDATLTLYQRVAVAQAEAGADVCAPSGMMDGQVGAIRSALDGRGYSDVSILAYSAKYASALYGPFRDAVDVSIIDGGDRTTYQQAYGNVLESLREIELDVAEGADMVMVKPATTYLDVIAAARRSVNVPVAAYHVSGEYSMIHAAAQRGWVDLEGVAIEQLTAIKRAGADFILTYFAPLVAEWAQRTS